MKLLQEGNPLIRAAVRAGMSEPTARPALQISVLACPKDRSEMALTRFATQ